MKVGIAQTDHVHRQLQLFVRYCVPLSQQSLDTTISDGSVTSYDIEHLLLLKYNV